MAELLPDDHPVAPDRRRTPAGLWWAVALALVVVAVAGWVALRPSGQTTTVDRLDNTVRPAGPTGLAGSGTIVGRAAPVATFPTFGAGSSSLAAYRGRPLVVNFFASWCVPCAQEMPAFERVHKRLGERVAFVGIDVTDGETPARRLIEQTGITYDTGRDPQGDILRSFGAVTMPTTVLIRADGSVAAMYAGELSEADLDRHIREQLQP